MLLQCHCRLQEQRCRWHEQQCCSSLASAGVHALALARVLHCWLMCYHSRHLQNSSETAAAVVAAAIGMSTIVIVTRSSSVVLAALP